MIATPTTAPTGSTLDLRNARHGTVRFSCWPTKKAALAALAPLRGCGLNRDRDIQIHQAETYLSRYWVIGRPDHYEGVTYLMTGDGRWIAGRLTDNPCFCNPQCVKDHPVPWTPLGRDPQPATVTHDYRYSAGSVGVLGGDGKPLMSGGGLGVRPTEVLHWMASVWCIACQWSTHDSHEDSVRASARWHREHPERYDGHHIPRRIPHA